MAIVTDRFMTLREGWLTVDITYDDATLRVQRILVTCNAPVPVYVALYRGNSNQPWREATLQNGEVYDQSRPFGGGFNSLDQITGMGVSVTF